MRMQFLALPVMAAVALPSACLAQSSTGANVTLAAQQRITVPTCSTSEAREYAVCLREARVRRAARALNDILAISLDGGGTQGGAAECAAAAEDDGANTLDDVDSLSFDDGICIWTCKAFTTGNSSAND